MLRMQKAAFLTILVASLTSGCSQAVRAQDDTEAQVAGRSIQTEQASTSIEEAPASTLTEAEQQPSPTSEGTPTPTDPAQMPADAASSAVEEGTAQSEEEPEQAAEETAGTPAAAEENPVQEEDPTETERPPAQPQENAGRVRGSIVQIVVLGQNGEVKRVGSGFVAAADRVLTAAHLVLDENRIVAVPLTTRTELVARIIHWNERSGLALLAVNGLNLPALPFAKDGFAPGRLVYSVGFVPDGCAGVGGGVF